mmetsp:Transcript_7744/g.19989  ORF Transcript_7744/g.19989 Transcript_7744/m.19989 type:complete len:80 (+) Transcript_7744:838-1077(+)
MEGVGRDVAWMIEMIAHQLKLTKKPSTHQNNNINIKHAGGGRATTTQHITVTATTTITPSLYFSNSATEGCRSVGGVST